MTPPSAGGLGRSQDRTGKVSPHRRSETRGHARTRPPQAFCDARGGLTGLADGIDSTDRSPLRAVSLIEGLAASRTTCDAWISLAWTSAHAADYDRAFEQAAWALAAKQECGSRADEAMALDAFAAVRTLSGDHREARRYCDETLDVVRELGVYVPLQAEHSNTGAGSPLRSHATRSRAAPGRCLESPAGVAFSCATAGPHDGIVRTDDRPARATSLGGVARATRVDPPDYQTNGTRLWRTLVRYSS